MTHAEAKKLAYRKHEQARRAQEDGERKQLRRANNLDRIARLVYDTDRDDHSDISEEG